MLIRNKSNVIKQYNEPVSLKINLFYDHKLKMIPTNIVNTVVNIDRG